MKTLAVQRTPAQRPNFPKKEPLVEQMAKNRRPNGFFSRMDDDHLIGFAKGVIRTNMAASFSGLENADRGLYEILETRKLLDRVGLSRMRRRWANIPDDDIVTEAWKLIQRKGIESREGLKRECSAIYKVLATRKIIGKLRFERQKRDWSRFGDDELVSMALKSMEETKARTKEEFRKANDPLYQVLWRKGILKRIAFVKGKGTWIRMSNAALVRYARDFIGKKRICGRRELERANQGLYKELCKRRLIRFIGLKDRRIGLWGSLGNDELISHAQRRMKSEKMRNKTALRKKYPGLYCALFRRRLLSAFDKRPRWKNMSDSGILEYAKGYILIRSITTRSGLMSSSSGLCTALAKRNLLDRLIPAKPRRRWSLMGDGQIVQYANAFMARHGIRTRGKLELINGKLYSALVRRNLVRLTNAEKVPVREWEKMPEQEIMDHARKTVLERGIKTKKDLRVSDHGLYKALWQRRLLCNLGLKDGRKQI